MGRQGIKVEACVEGWQTGKGDSRLLPGHSGSRQGVGSRKDSLGRGQEKYDWQLLGFESEPTPMAQVLQARSLQYGTIL